MTIMRSTIQASIAIMALLVSATGPVVGAADSPASPAQGQPTNIETQDEIDFAGGPAVMYDINTPDGEKYGIGVYRSRVAGQY